MPALILFVHLDRVVPICLPLAPEKRSKDFEDTELFVAGWGRTTEGGLSADVLQQVQLPVLNNEICKDRYRKQGKLIDEQKQFNNAVMCVGYLEGSYIHPICDPRKKFKLQDNHLFQAAKIRVKATVVDR